MKLRTAALLAISLGVSGGVARANQSPISISGYNQDMVVETGASFSSTTLTATMDGGTGLGGNTWYQIGQNSGAPVTGIPSGTTFTSAADPNTQFAIPSAVGTNTLLLDANTQSATVALTTPASYSSLSFLTASGNGAGTIGYTIHYQNGGTDTGSVTSPDWFGGSSVAVSANGRINSGGYDAVGSGNPNLYQVNFPTVTGISPITSIDLTWTGAGASTETAIMGLSGTSVPEPASIGLFGVAALGLLKRKRRAV